MPNIVTFDHLHKKSVHTPRYYMGYRLGPSPDKRINKIILHILEYVFIFYRFFNKPPINNIIRVHEDVMIYKRNKVLTCKALLDTGNEAITIVNREALYKLGYLDSDFNEKSKITTYGIGGGKEEMYTIYLHYTICDFKHQGYVGISKISNEISKKYDMIISQSDISKMYHSGYTLQI